MSTLTRAYDLARTGRYRDVASLKAKLKEDGHRAVDALLGARSTQEHLKAICAAAIAARAADAPQTAEA